MIGESFIAGLEGFRVLAKMLDYFEPSALSLTILGAIFGVAMCFPVTYWLAQKNFISLPSEYLCQQI